MNGMYILKLIKRTRYEFYWAPVDPELNFPNPSIEELESKWGLAVVDLSWVCEDPRPKHLRASPLPYPLHAPYEVISYPQIGGQEYSELHPLKRSRGWIVQLEQKGLFGADGKKRDRFWWASG